MVPGADHIQAAEFLLLHSAPDMFPSLTLHKLIEFCGELTLRAPLTKNNHFIGKATCQPPEWSQHVVELEAVVAKIKGWEWSWEVLQMAELQQPRFSTTDGHTIVLPLYDVCDEP